MSQLIVIAPGAAQSGAMRDPSPQPSSLVVAPVAWRMAQLSLLFLFDVARISRGDGDLLEPVILTAILQANQATLLSDPHLQLRYDEAAWALPDEDRRPISVHAIAQSLGLPFETVRRRAKALEARGLCVSTGGGVYVPRAAVTSPHYLRVQADRVGRLAALHAEVVAADMLAPAPGLEGFIAGSVRAADRLLANYMLRACGGLLELTGSAMDGMVLMALAATNLRELQVAKVGEWATFGALAAPCNASRLAEALGMPNETVRRHMHRLEASGFCRRGPSGWTADVPRDGEALLGRLVNENAQNLRRLFASLAELHTRADPQATRQAL